MKNILLCVTGGIAGYKSANIVSKLKKKGYEVKVVMTENATKIITPLTMETLSRNKVYVDMWDANRSYEVEHIALGQWADIILVAPATYNIVGKVANGIADDLLSTIIAGFNKKVYFALAMNVNMYENPILKENIEKLESFGYKFIEADEGFLACNVNAKGRLKDENDIIDIIEEDNKEIERIFEGKKILITAGRTEEAIDPIRYLSNKSSGKMGYALAVAGAKLGAEVILISGPTDLEIPKNLTKFIQVRSAREMYNKTIDLFPKIDIGIACAAVADYRPKNYSTEKIKKKDGNLVIEFERNPDILLEMGKLKTNQILVGFAAETENIIENAIGKLKKKNLDMIVANNARNMQSDTNTINIITDENSVKELPEKSKEELAFDILYEIKKIIK